MQINLTMGPKTKKAALIILAIFLLGGYGWVTYRQGTINGEQFAVNQTVKKDITNLRDTTQYSFELSSQNKFVFDTFYARYSNNQKIICDSLSVVAGLTQGNAKDIVKQVNKLTVLVNSVVTKMKEQDKSITALKSVWQDNIAKFYATSTTRTNSTGVTDTNTKKIVPVNTSTTVTNTSTTTTDSSKVTKSDLSPTDKSYKKKRFQLNLVKKKPSSTVTKFPGW